ncbi:MAG: hypothetical protein IH987_08425 [Planctomycetes bacterium]|nr:hypothetical protein [Planctomycetota bacterium]
MAFVDLERSFVRIEKNIEPDPDMFRYWGRMIDGGLQWDALLEHRRVVLLAEASSGKTEEFRNQALALRADDRAAFFVAIEELADHGLENALEPSELAVFEQWRSGTASGFFFLDSIDEARLNRKSLDVALKHFARGLGSSLGRAHVFISCRVSDWKEPGDRRAIESLLPFPRRHEPAQVAQDPDGLLLDPIFEKDSQDEEPTSEGGRSDAAGLLVVQLLPMSDSQRRTLADASGIDDPEKLVAAISRRGLDSLAERPGDLLDLAEYWKSYGRFDSFAKMTLHAITQKLSERDKFRPDNATITNQKIKEGAERVAAALTFGKSLTLRAPGYEPDPTLATGALDPASILDDWTDVERNALLRRGVFSPSTFGRVRFHHRSTQEYLTASWLDRLISKGCPKTEIFDLLFADAYGVESVVPSLRPVAAWLALKRDNIRAEIVRREPLVLLQHGDPGALPLATKRSLLIKYATKHLAGEIADDSLDHRSLWMFAEAELVEVIYEAWDLNDRDDFHIDLLRIVREGAISACVELARQVARNKSANDYHRIVALEAMSECGDHKGLAERSRQLMRAPSKANPRIAVGFAKILFPGHLSVKELLRLIDLSPPSTKFSTGGFAYDIFDLWKACPSAVARNELAAGLAEICLRPPHVNEFQRVSQKHGELACHIGPIAHKMAIELGDRRPPDILIRLLMVMERAERDYMPDDDVPPIREIIRDNATLNRSLFWHDVDDQRLHQAKGEEMIYHWQIFFGESPLWELKTSDLPWLYKDLVHRPRESDRRIALSAIVPILDRGGTLHDDISSLREKIVGRNVLNEDLDGYLTPPVESAVARRLRISMEAAKRERAKQQEINKASWIEFRTELQADTSKLTDTVELNGVGGEIGLLNLTKWLHKRTKQDHKDAALQWRLLDEGFGSDVAEAYRDGMKALWRITAPERPKRTKGSVTTIKWTTILSVAGLAIEATEDKAWATQLSPKEALHAAHHGCTDEQGYPEWIESLALAHTNEVLPILQETIKAEWSSTARGRSDFLNRYSNPASPIFPPLEDPLFAILTGRAPPLISNLDLGLQILQRLELDDRQRSTLEELAVRRFRRSTADQKIDRALRYLALLFHTNAEMASDLIVTILREAKGAAQKSLAEGVIGALFSTRDHNVLAPLNDLPVATLEALVLIAYQFVSPKDDNVHEEIYRPNGRDKAEDGRGAILGRLLESTGADAYAAVCRLADNPIMQSRSRRIRELARGMAERDTERPAWTVDETLALERQFCAPVKTGVDLFRVVLSSLDDICTSFSNSDASSRRVLESAVDEDAVQSWLAEQLEFRSSGRFHVLRELEVADGNKPDIVVVSASAPCQVAIEVKHGGMDWSVRDFVKALRGQLAEDYLRSATRRHGVFLITHHGKRTWRHPKTKAVMNFSDVIAYLTSIASTLLRNESGSIEVAVRGIDASPVGVKEA